MLKDALLPRNAILKKAVRAILRKSGAAPQPHMFECLENQYIGTKEGSERRIMRAVLMQALSSPPPEPIEFKLAEVPEIEPDPEPIPEPDPEPVVPAKPKKEEKMMSLDLNNAAAMLQFGGDEEEEEKESASIQLDELEREKREGITLSEFENETSDTVSDNTETSEGPALRTPNIDFAVEDISPSQQNTSEEPKDDLDPMDAIVAEEVAEALTEAPDPEFTSVDDSESVFAASESQDDASEGSEDPVQIDDVNQDTDSSEDFSEAATEETTAKGEEQVSAEENKMLDTQDAVEADDQPNTNEDISVEADDASKHEDDTSPPEADAAAEDLPSADEKEQQPEKKDTETKAKKGVPQTDLAALGSDSSLFDQLGDSFGDMDD